MSAAQVDVNPEWNNFNDVYLPFINESAAKDIEIFYGGSSSGKSNFLAHRVVLDVMRGGHNYLCVRRVANTVTKSLANEITKAISALCVEELFNIVPSQGHITCVNGYQILFTGMDDPEKVKSITPKMGVLTDIWYEEATEGTYEDIKQLQKRLRGLAVYRGRQIPKRIVMSFNPIFKTHWIYTHYFQPIPWADKQTYHET